MAFLLIVPPGEGARLQDQRGKVPFMREFSVCENVLAVAMPPGFNGTDAVTSLIHQLGAGEFALVEYGGMVEGEGQPLAAVAAAVSATVRYASQSTEPQKPRG